MMELAIFITGFAGASLLLLSGLALFRSKDVFAMTHVALICGLYALPLLLISFSLEKFSLAVLLKILLLILFNFLATQMICYLAAKEALKNGVLPDVVAEIQR